MYVFETYLISSPRVHFSFGEKLKLRHGLPPSVLTVVLSGASRPRLCFIPVFRRNPISPSSPGERLKQSVSKKRLMMLSPGDEGEMVWRTTGEMGEETWPPLSRSGRALLPARLYYSRKESFVGHFSNNMA